MSQFSFKDVGNNIIYFGSIIGAGFTIYQFYKNLPSKKKVTFEKEEEEEKPKPKRKEIEIDMD